MRKGRSVEEAKYWNNIMTMISATVFIAICSMRLFALAIVCPEATKPITKPHIVVIMADDLGFNDVSFNGQNQFLTPNLDALAYSGIILNKHYTPPMCSPSRSAFLTGKYPIRTGMQHYVIANDEPWGLCTSEVLASQVFKEAGYSTNLVGKWHLGYFKQAFTPTLRGFDHHYGYMGGYVDYWDRHLHMQGKNYSRGLDFYNDLSINYNGGRTYATDLLTKEAVNIIRRSATSKKPLFLIVNHLAPHAGNEDDPMQAPEEEIEKFQYIKDKKRRIYAAMVSKLDQSVGTIVKALKDKKMLCNSIILFYSDNGAPTIGLHSNSGSNYPFRSQKNSPFEGALRVPAILYSPLLNQKSYVSRQAIHVTDWLPTFASVAGIRLKNANEIDGIDLWDVLSNARRPRERTILHNIDEVDGYAALSRGSWKYINYTTLGGMYDDFYGQIGSEIYPRTDNYFDEVIGSEVSKALGNSGQEDLSSPSGLTPGAMARLRSQATVRCFRNVFMQGEQYKCKPLREPCLFNLDYDPCEQYNLAGQFGFKLRAMQQRVSVFRRQLVASVNQNADPNANPALHSNTWTWWVDDTLDIGIPNTYCKNHELDIRSEFG